MAERLPNLRLESFKGIDFIRAGLVHALARGDPYAAARLAEQKYPYPVAHYLKTAVAAGTSTDSVWAGPLGMRPALRPNMSRMNFRNDPRENDCGA